MARVFGPQKGATPAQVEQLAAGLENWARVLTRDLPVTGDLYGGTGTGASGGLGAGLAALGARLLPRFEVLLDHLDLDARLARADLVLTAEGALDHQTPRGKVPAEVARRAKLHGRPVLALAGTLGEGAHTVPGVDAYTGILPAPMARPRRSARRRTPHRRDRAGPADDGTGWPGCPPGFGPGRRSGTARAVRTWPRPVRATSDAVSPPVSGTQRPSSVR